MDLTSPLRTLVPSLDSAVLEVLARTHSSLSAMQIWRLSSRGTRAGQRPVLERLVEHGLVLAARSNTGYLYRLNREHVLVDAVLTAVDARQVLLDRLREACERLDPVPVHASVFGSFARGEGDAESDIDLLLVLPDPVDLYSDPWREQLDRLDSAVLAWAGNRLETVVLAAQGLVEAVTGGESLVGTWRQDAVTLVGPEPAELIDHLTRT